MLRVGVRAALGGTPARSTERAAVGGWRPVSRQRDGAGCRRLHGRHAARARCVRWWRRRWEVGTTGRAYAVGEVLPVSTRPRRAESSVGLRNRSNIAVPGAVEAPRVNDGAWLVRLHRRRKISSRSAKAGLQRHCARAAGGAWTDGFAPGRGEEPRAACWSPGHRAAKGVAVACSLCRVGAGRLGDRLTRMWTQSGLWPGSASVSCRKRRGCACRRPRQGASVLLGKALDLSDRTAGRMWQADGLTPTSPGRS